MPPPASVMPVVAKPLVALAPGAHSRRKLWKLGPVARPVTVTAFPGFSSAYSAGVLVWSGFVSSR